MTRIFLCGLVAVWFISVCTIPGSAASSVSSKMEIVKSATKTLLRFLSSKKSVTPKNVVKEFIEAVPVVGEFVKSAADDKTLKEIIKMLKFLSDDLKQIMNYMKEIGAKIEFLPVENQLTDSVAKIDSCSSQKLELYGDPQNTVLQEFLFECSGDIISSIYYIYKVLMEIQYPAIKVFQDRIIKKDGFCNATTIRSTYKYFLGQLISGCESVILAEEVKYNGSSSIRKEQCNTWLDEVHQHLTQVIYKRCTKDNCSIIINTLKNVLQVNDSRPLDIMNQEFSVLFPWFTFAVFKSLAELEITITGNRSPSSVTFFNDTDQFIILWTPYETSSTKCMPEGSKLWFNLEFKKENYVNSSIGFNGTRNFYTETAVFLSFILEDKSVSEDRCRNSKHPYSRTTSGSTTLVYNILTVVIIICGALKAII